MLINPDLFWVFFYPAKDGSFNIKEYFYVNNRNTYQAIKPANTSF